MIGLWNVNFLNQNMQRAYPLTIESTKECAYSHAIKLPDDLILAMRISVNSTYDLNITGFFVKNIVVMSTGCTITLGYDDGKPHSDRNPYTDVAVVHVLKNSEQITYTLTGLGEFDDISGFIAINTKSSFFNYVGSFPFNPEGTQIEPDCITPSLRGIRSLAINDGIDTSERIYGDVILKAGANVTISAPQYADGTSYITINAICDSNYEEGCDCNACDCDSEREPVKTINGVGPDSSGNIILHGLNCLTISEGSGSSITLDDTCATPGCSCEQLNDMATELNDLKNGARTLDNFVNNIYTQVTAASTIIAGNGTGGSCKTECTEAN